MAITTAWHGKTFDEHVKLRDSAAKDGFRFLSLSIHGASTAPHYTAVMIKRAVVVAQRDWPLLTNAEFQKVFDEQAKQGFGPVMVAAAGTAGDPRFAVVFQMQSPIALTRFGLRSGAETDLESIQGVNQKARADNLILHSLALYGDADTPRYAAIWLPNPNKTVWNADGVNETSDQYQARVNAQVAGWCRPAHVATNGAGRFCSLFVHNEIGPWVARHGLTGEGYQNEFNAWTAKGYFPLSVQGGGSGAATRYTALFAKQEEPVPQIFTPVGPSANTAIDNVIMKAMRDSPIWNASLAIVHGKKLVYARAYSYGEPDWPLCQPTSRFRIASVSKTVTALAIYQLIGEGKLALTDKLQDMLQLKTPAGGAPADNRFKDVTVKQLLEHTSGIDDNSFRNEGAILGAFKTAQPAGGWHLPMSAEQCDSYIASLGMTANPGTTIGYNNCGYYLLGRVVAKKRARVRPIDAFQDFLFDPLFIHRIRRATSLIGNTPADEARYRSQEIPVQPSVMSDAQPLVPMGYGTEHFERQEGGGGLSAAATDLARLIAIMQSPNDNPAMKRSTIEMMLNNGIKTAAAWSTPTKSERSGHGWDGIRALGNHKFYGQKGGDLSTTGNVLQFDGDWGFAMCWGGKAIAAGNWYADYPAVMDVAKAALANAPDLFPQFGMPSL